MKTIMLLLLSCTFYALPCRAQLGATVAQCEARFGKTIKVFKDGDRAFESKGFSFVVGFDENKLVHWINIEHVVKNEAVEPMTEDEITLALSLGGVNWEVVWENHLNGHHLRKMQTHDGTAFGTVDRDVWICTRKLHDDLDMEMQTRRARRL